MRHKMSNIKAIEIIFTVIGKKSNQTSATNADQEIRTLRSMDNAGNSVNLFSALSVYPRAGIFWSASLTHDRFNMSHILLVAGETKCWWTCTTLVRLLLSVVLIFRISTIFAFHAVNHRLINTCNVIDIIFNFFF